MSESERQAWRFILEGPAGLDDVSLRDVSGFLDGIVRLIALGAADSLGRPMAGRGRYQATIEQAADVRLVALRSGSLAAEVAEPPAAPALEAFGHVETITVRAVAAVMDSVEHPSEHAPVAAFFAALFDRYAAPYQSGAIAIVEQKANAPRVVRVTEAKRAELAPIAAVPAEALDTQTLQGRVYEANVDSHTAEMRTTAGDKVRIEFEEALDGEIKLALGGRVRVITEPAASRHGRVRAREISPAAEDDFALEGISFWTDPDLDELLATASASPVFEPDALKVHGVRDDEWDALYQTLANGG